MRSPGRPLQPVRLNRRQRRQLAINPDALLLRVSEAGQRYGIPDSTLRRWIRTGAVPVGAVVRFPSGWLRIRDRVFRAWLTTGLRPMEADPASA